MRLTETADALRRSLGVPAAVLPMSDAPVRTQVKVRGAWLPFQAFMIRERAAGPIEDVAFRGARDAAPSPEVLAALAAARVVVIGPSNPVISIGPMLAMPELRAALAATPAPVVAVSPLVGGRVVKGPTAEFLAWAGQPLSSDGIVACYAGLLHGLVADSRTYALPTLVTDVGLDDPGARRRVAEETLGFALALGRLGRSGARRARTWSTDRDRAWCNVARTGRERLAHPPYKPAVRTATTHRAATTRDGSG